MKRKFFIYLSGFLICGGVVACVHAFALKPAHRLVFGERGMVVAAEENAARAGLEILQNGGNAVDAAVAIGFALAVTLPQAGNLGGGGFMMVHLAGSGQTLAVDYRETAPAAALRDMFLDDKGNYDPERSQTGYPAAGVPGSVAGLALALEKFGTLPLKEVLAPAIGFAEKGFPVSDNLAADLKAHRKKFAPWAESMRIFFKPGGSPYEPGDRLVQADLARSLKRIAEDGPDAFYGGAIGQKIAADMEAHAGLVSATDLKNYRARIRQPVHGTYRGYDVYSMPPPSSGGIHLIQMLNILEGFPLGRMGPANPEAIHLMAEAMKLAFADRSRHLGDPDFWDVPRTGLTSKAYAADLRKTIDPNRARPSSEIGPGDPARYESKQTTHFSVMDQEGNVVANTYTLNFGFGSGIVAAGTGILLNNEMDDFSAKPGVPNAYGLVGGEANAVDAGKRPLSSMTPTIVLKQGRPFLATGSRGGSRIITTVLQVILNVIDHGMGIGSAVDAPRAHHQWLPDELWVEPGWDAATRRRLAALGHRWVDKAFLGSAHSILRAPEGFYGAADTRRPGAVALAY